MQKNMQKKLGAPVTLKSAVARATSVMFVFQLFGALGAGFVFVAGNVLHITIPATNFWQVFWHLCFWATDFAFVCFTLVLAYLIAGIPAIAPALTLSLYYSHFAGLYGGETISAPLYTDFFTPPQGGAGGLNIGYMGFLFIALAVGYGIRGLYTLWNHIKNTLAPNFDKPISAIASKYKQLKDLKGIAVLEGIDLIVLVLILPIVTALITYFTVQYGFAMPMKALGETLEPLITDTFAAGKNVGGGLLLGVLVGADTIGPLSMAAFRAASNAAAAGNGVPMTAFALTFAATGWVSFAAYFLSRVTKRGGKMDTDDMNLAVSGPINALFDNMKLTVAFGMPFTYRSPISVIPGTIVTCALTALLACAAGLNNALYTAPDYLAKFTQGDYYTSFAQPHLKLSESNHPLLTLLIIALGVLIGAAVVIAIRELVVKWQKGMHIYEETDGDIVLEMRKLAGERAEEDEEEFHAKTHAARPEKAAEPVVIKPPVPDVGITELDFQAWLDESRQRILGKSEDE
ncbi:MAG: hypothetical protein LBJ12_00875 [Oscillospiraceae bacterium]|jgi:fructose-specific phosphotransferase system IIC component|nr:hypothetical protein [Oscillospiraceae bacterium]